VGGLLVVIGIELEDEVQDELFIACDIRWINEPIV
jgi:hypothetical protein